MLRLTLAQMRRSLGRLTAAGVAIVLGTAFLTATLLASNALTRTTYDALTTSLAESDLVVLSNEGLTAGQLDEIRSTPGVEGVQGQVTTGAELGGPGGTTWTGARTQAEHPRLESSTLTEGRHPESADEIALPASTAERLELDLGDTTTWRVESLPTGSVDPADGDEPTSTTGSMTVVGLLEDSAADLIGVPGDALVTQERFEAWTGPVDETWSWNTLVATGPDVEAARQAVEETLTDTGAIVRTQDEHAVALLDEMTGQTRGLTGLVLGFGAVALLVAALVIANTFQVLVAQRTRTLALLRCVGAGKRQLRRSVVTEALLLGTTASVTGLLLGGALVQGVLSVLGAQTDVPLPATISPTPAAVLVPLAAGLLVTLLAALAPARAATRVSPLAALSPVAGPGSTERGGRARAWLSGLLVVGGLTGMVAGMAATQIDSMTGLALAVLGGAVSFVGVLVSAVFWVPRVVGLLGRLGAGRGGVPARLAAANSVRNPRRTAATSAALLIGVTLVAMMATGAATTRVALDRTLDERFAVDVAVTGYAEAEQSGLPESFLASTVELDGVGATSRLTGGPVDLSWPDGDGLSLSARGVDPAELRELVRAPEHVDGLGEGTVLVSEQIAGWYGVPEAGALTLTGPSGASTTLDVVTTPLEIQSVLVTRDVLEEVVPEAPTTELWMRLDDLDAATDVSTAITDAATEAGISANVVGAAIERAFYQQVVDTLLAVVVGLLAVAVVIALVGVANTLSLSVIERRRESATLRAIGLSRRQLRGTLAVEGVLIALVGALVGSALGLLYGWAGSWTVLAELSDVRLVVPWGHLGLVLAVAVLAGLLASVLPGRSAARTSPVEALAVD